MKRMLLAIMILTSSRARSSRKAIDNANPNASFLRCGTPFPRFPV